MLSARLLASVSLLGLAWSSDVPSRPAQRPLLPTAVRERLQDERHEEVEEHHADDNGEEKEVEVRLGYDQKQK